MNNNFTQNHPDEWLLHELLDGELSVTEEEPLRLHISECEDCRSKLQELSGLYATIQRLPDLPLERDLASLVEGRILARQKPTRPFSNPSLVVVFQAIAVTAILLVSKNTLATFLQPLLTTLIKYRGEVQPGLWITTRWNSILEPYWSGLADLVHSIQAPDLSILSQYPLTLILVAASILWLAGNGLLFWNTNLTRRNP